MSVLTGLGCASAATPPLSAAARDDEVVFIGMCDASGAVPLSAHTFAVADDEDNVLRVYDANRGGPALYERDISAGIGIRARRPKHPWQRSKPPAEADIEAATRHGDLALWLTSHSRSSKGKLKPERLRLFATSLPLDGGELRVVGRAYRGLIDDLSADPRYAGFALQSAAEQAPKTAAGLNIEGMTERSEGGVLIGLRAPNPGGRALLFILENPEEVILEAAVPKFGEPILLDLTGLGVRALSRWREQYLIAAGDWSDERASRLFIWDGESSQVQPVAIDFQHFNPEGFFTPEERDEVMVLSDDGTESSTGDRCKDRSDASQKHFRGRWIRLPAP